MADRPDPDPSWLDRHIWQIQPVRDLLTIAAVFAIVWVGYEASIVTVPLLLAIALAYLVEPIIRWAETKRVRRRFAITTLIIGSLLLIALPALFGLGVGVVQGKELIERIGDRAGQVVMSVDSSEDDALRGRIPDGPWRDIRDFVVDLKLPPHTEPAELADPAADPSADPTTNPATNSDEAQTDQPNPQPSARIAVPRSEFGELVAFTLTWARDNARAVASEAANIGVGAIDVAVTTLGGAVSLGFTAFLTLFFFYFVSNAWGRVLKARDRFIPERHSALIQGLLEKFDRVIAGFVRGRITIALIQSVLFTVGYWIIGVPTPMLLGPAVAVLSIVPYLAIVGIPVSIVLLYVEPNGGFMDAWWWTLGAPLIVYNLGQALDDYVWTPMIQGKETGLGTASILFATFAGGAFMGIYGLLLAIPLAACIKILFDDVLMPAYEAWAKGQQKDFLPLSTSTKKDD